MLILTRSVGEQICIGDDVIVTVVRVGQDTVKIGVDAPDGYPIMRRELYVRPATEEQSLRPPEDR